MAAAIGLSLDLLDADQRARFGELGIFPEDVDIPVGIVARLWRETGGLDEFATEDLLSELFDLSLLLDLDLDRRTFRFHDTVRQFLQDAGAQGGPACRAARRLRRGHRRHRRGAGRGSGGDGLFLPLPAAAPRRGRRARALDALLLDPGWLQAKLAATASPLALVADYEQLARARCRASSAARCG